MMRIIISLLYLLMLICETGSIICIVCTNLNNPSCGDPFTTVGSIYAIASNQSYCRKSVTVTGIIERSASGQICSTSDIVGVTSVYCCSDQDNCNKATNLNQSILSIISFSTFFLYKVYLLEQV